MCILLSATNYRLEVDMDSSSAEVKGNIDITFHGSASKQQSLRLSQDRFVYVSKIFPFS